MTWTPINVPPAGWYPDPGGQPSVRWWDGRAWTSHLAPYQPDAVAPRQWPVPSAPALPGAGPADAEDGWSGGRLPAWTAWWGLAGVFAGFMAAGLLQGFGLLVFPGSKAAEILLGEMGLWVGFGGTCVLVSRRFGNGSLVRDFGLRWKWVDVGYGLLAALACLAVAAVVSIAFSGTKLAGSNTDIVTSQRGSTLGVAIVTVVAAVGAPIFEELFFRGFLRQALGSRFGRGAVWAQALLFGLAHYQFSIGLGNVSVVTATAGLGVVLGYTALYTRRLGAGMIAHSLFNLFVTLSIIGLIGARV